jgi:hypothetical protein
LSATHHVVKSVFEAHTIWSIQPPPLQPPQPQPLSSILSPLHCLLGCARMWMCVLIDWLREERGAQRVSKHHLGQTTQRGGL